MSLFVSEGDRKDPGPRDGLGAGNGEGRGDRRSRGHGGHLPLSAIVKMESSGMPTPRASSLNSCSRLSLSCGSRPARGKQRSHQAREGLSHDCHSGKFENWRPVQSPRPAQGRQALREGRGPSSPLVGPPRPHASLFPPALSGPRRLGTESRGQVRASCLPGTWALPPPGTADAVPRLEFCRQEEAKPPAPPTPLPQPTQLQGLLVAGPHRRAWP